MPNSAESEERFYNQLARRDQVNGGVHYTLLLVSAHVLLFNNRARSDIPTFLVCIRSHDIPEQSDGLWKSIKYGNIVLNLNQDSQCDHITLPFLFSKTYGNIPEGTEATFVENNVSSLLTCVTFLASMPLFRRFVVLSFE